MEKSKAYIGHIAALISTIIYAYNANTMKYIMPNEIDSFGLVLMRAICTFIIFGVLSIFIKQRPVTISKKDRLKIMYLGVMGFSIQLLLYYEGVKLTGPIDIVVIRSLIPIMILAVSIIFHQEKSSSRKIIGLILGIIGVIYISIVPHQKGTEDSFLGGMLIFISTFIVAIFTVQIAQFSRTIPMITLMKWLSLYGMLFSIPFGLHDIIYAPLFSHKFNPEILWYLIVACILVGGGAIFLSIVSLKYISPLVRSSYYYFLPIIGTIISILLHLQYPTLHDPIAFIIILAGFLMISFKKGTRNF